MKDDLCVSISADGKVKGTAFPSAAHRPTAAPHTLMTPVSCAFAVARVVTDLEKLEVIRDLEGHEGNAVWYASTRHTLLRGKLLTSAG